MDLTWLSQLDSTIVMEGAVGNLLGNLATQAVNGILDAGTRQVRRQFEKPPERQALDTAMAQALAITLTWLTDDSAQFKHLATLFEVWLGRDAVAEELYQLVEPKAERAWDLELLCSEFEAAGWSPETLDPEQSFAAIVAKLVDAFANAAAKQPLLQSQIQIQLLHETANRLGQLVQQQDTQIALQQQLVTLFQRFAPLDLDRTEEPYLRQLYWQCNDLPLARDRRSQERYSKARLQRVYVELYLKQPPSLEQMLQRLKITDKRRQATVKQRLTAFLDKLAAQALPGVPGERKSGSRQNAILTSAQAIAALAIEQERTDYPYATVLALRGLTEEQRKVLAKTLAVSPADLAAACINVTPLEALIEHRQLVILGDPGSGKSTYTQRLAALLAAAGCNDREIYADLDQDEVAALEGLLTTLGRRLLPVRIVLSQWAKHLRPQATGCADDLVVECVRLLAKSTNYGLDQTKHFGARLLGEAPSTLILLDGLDEVSNELARGIILRAIADFHDSFRTVPLIVTCRIRPYRDFEQLLNLPSFTLAPLEQAQMGRFIERWYREMQRVGSYAADRDLTPNRTLLIRALQDSRRRELYEMAQTPLLLTSMAHINSQYTLPDSRAQLYELLVNQLLYEWERQKQEGSDVTLPLDELLSEVKLGLNELGAVLNRIAYDLHSQHLSSDTVDISYAQLRAHFVPLHRGSRPDRERWMAGILGLIADRSGLIYATDVTPGAESYKFSHRTFQEYLAARHLATGTDDDRITHFVRYIDDEGWYETILLAIGYLVERGQLAEILLLMVRLFPADLDTEAAVRRILLLGEAYARILKPPRAKSGNDPERAERVYTQLVDLLTKVMENSTLPARQRLDAGLLLADLNLLPTDLDDLVTINAGPTLGYAFQIGKYPVTNHQYQAFMQADGYAPVNETRWWSEEGRKYKAQYGYTEPYSLRSSSLNRCTQPVCGLSWFEAEAYCHWLTDHWRASGKIDGGYKVRLPTRAEWEATARSKHEKQYPWRSDAFDPACANTNESNLGQTSPVHMYPAGQSADGVWDLSGNVWEWTCDRKEDNQEVAWLKGGCYYMTKERATASAADDDHRRFRLGNSGFRVVVVPISR